MKVIVSGLESQGKSLKLAMIVVDLAYRNAEVYKKFGIIRPIASNLYFSKEFYDYVTEQLKIPIIYWDNLDDLVKLEHCDVIIDEVGNYFDSRLWADLSLEVRVWLTQGAKCGVDIYGSAQDFAQVDKSFRRLVNHLFEVTKIVGSDRPSVTKPKVDRIWGICMLRTLNPKAYNEDRKEFESGWLPSFFLIDKVYCSIFDTTQKIKRSKPLCFRHEVRECSSCDFKKVIHA